jgi:hypothetical protein
MVLLAALAGTAQARTDGDRAVASAGERLRANDCPGAVKALNAALHAGYPEAALLAGTLFEAISGIVREIEGRPEFVYTPATSHFAIEDRSATFAALHGYNEVIAKAIGQAAQRYSMPAGMPRDWRVSFVLDIETDKSRWW